jgi:apolipoprotein N-acyltransferase
MTKLTRITLLLTLGALFHYLSNGKHSIAFAAWLFPVLLLQVSRKEKSSYSFLIIPLLVGACSQLSFWKFTYSDPKNILFYLPFILGVVMGEIFYLDRILFLRNKGFISTLIFPIIYTSFDFLLNLLNPFGTTGVLGYSQFEFSIFSQLVSITGMWGLTFIITWFGAMTYWLLDGYQQPKRIRKGIVFYACIMTSIMLYGLMRLNIPSSTETVKIAGIHTSDKDIEVKALWNSMMTNDSLAFKKISLQNIKKLQQATIQQSNAGAKIIVWSEISPFIIKSDEDSLVRVFKKLALTQKIYLLTTPAVTSFKGKLENKILLFSPNGQLVTTHYKYGGNFMEGTIKGNEIITPINTPYGKISSIICWDGDFPTIVSQVGRTGTDILLIPASDWKEIDPVHSYVASFRGIENGCSVVRQTQNGLSMMTDSRGRIISQMDHFKSKVWVNIGLIPTKKIFTIYPIIGDFFGWLALLGLLIFILKARKNKIKVPV